MKKENLKMSGDSSIRPEVKISDIQIPRDKEIISLDERIKEKQSLQKELEKHLKELRWKKKSSIQLLKR
jgi:hypothetical protein